MSAEHSPGTPRGSAPQRLGKYELLGHWATGGMASLHLARATGIEGFEKIVILKQVLPELASRQEVVQLFLHEARLAATLHHPNIAQVYDVGVANGRYFFAMEFVHGQDVRSILKAAVLRRRRLSLDEAISIVLGVCAGLHHAHMKVGAGGRALGIIHRDVSPSNVLVAYDGSIKLVDFGIAKAVTRNEETRTGALRGKLSYMSPEQCQALPLDRRSDIFALGILLYELSTCRKLFRGKSDFEVLKQIVDQPLPRPSNRVPGYPPELEQIVLRALARRPDDRYATAQDLQLDLEAFARDHKLAISPVTLSRLMTELFANKIDAWHDAEREGKPLAAHLAENIEPVSPAATWMEPDAADPRDNASTVAEEVPTRWEGGGTLRARRTRWPLAVLGVGLVAATAGLVFIRTARINPAPEPQYILVQGAASPVAEAGRAPAHLVPATAPSPPAPTPVTAPTATQVATVEADPPAEEPAARPTPPASPASVEQPSPVPERDRPGRHTPARGRERTRRIEGPHTAAPNATALTRAFARRQPQVAHCFNSYVNDVTGAPEVAVRFEIGADGRVRSAEVIPAEIARTPLGACLAQVAKATDFGAQPAPLSFRIPITAHTR
jgi:serine/threonine protein kinase